MTIKILMWRMKNGRYRVTKKRTLDEVIKLRKTVIDDFRTGHIKSRDAIKLLKRYDEKIRALRRAKA